ncbi:sarcosine oxidase subunit gamma [Jannaschia sp. Os4]|uniref:sarcosine oxidase subunit gamma n=1 Tax=Jannaschia sp. Os4 TaxID=2807617 RepID=UPI001939EA7D|nr:sarcosine oxidase subunit gamma [Jannaschia sp. Os4]MBM2576276.1 sarcosine oxidase subunit gamma [Jannaschia sp. Os4]
MAEVTVSEIAAPRLTQIAAWPDALAEAGSAVAALAGVEAAPGPGLSATGPGGTLLRVEPLKWWWLHDGTAAPDGLAVVDLSAARVHVALSGPGARDVLARLVPLDVDGMAEGAVASTLSHHTSVTLWRAPEAWRLIVPRSYAADYRAMIDATAATVRVGS